MLLFSWTSFMATIQKIIGSNLVLCTKIAWKIQIWSWMWGMRCITMSNLTFSMILEHFFHFLAYIIQIFSMNRKLLKGYDPIILTNFLCSFTWWGSHAGLSWARWTFGMIYEEKSKFSPKNWWKCPVVAYSSAHISNLTPDSKNSGNFGPGNTLLTQHLLSGDQSRVC